MKLLKMEEVKPFNNKKELPQVELLSQLIKSQLQREVFQLFKKKQEHHLVEILYLMTRLQLHQEDT